MIKTTLKEIRRNSQIEGREEFKKWLDDNNLKPISVDKVAYSVSTYGLGAYLLRFTLNDGSSVNVSTGNRTSWLYSCGNSDYGL